MVTRRLGCRGRRSCWAGEPGPTGGAHPQRSGGGAVGDHGGGQGTGPARGRAVLPGDRVAALGRQMVLSITRYRQANQRSPTWAEALAGVDPALREPITTVPDSWPLRPAVWRRELRQRLMGELKHARWVTYTRTPRSLHPGDVGRGWLSTANPLPDGPHPPDATR